MVRYRAADDFDVAQGIRGKGRFERGGAARRRLYRDDPPQAPDRAGERHGPFPEAGPDIDHDRSGAQKAEDRRMHLRRMEQGMPAARIERSRHIDEIARAMQREPALPVAFEPTQKPLLPPAPDQPCPGSFRFARRAQLPKRLEERHHGLQIAGLLSEALDDHV